jgi:hypothetical protein
VYGFLEQMEAKSLLGSQYLNVLPLKKHQISEVLENIDKNGTSLNTFEKNTLKVYQNEFCDKNYPKDVLFYSSTDSTQVISGRIISEDDKYIYHNHDSSYTVNIKPLGSIDFLTSSNSDTSGNVLYGNLGFRLYGTLSNLVGYYLQATNGAVLAGSSEYAKYDPWVQKNIKFMYLNSDIDFTESHVAIEKDWFSASIGRISRKIGAALMENMLISDNSAPVDAITLGASFIGFDYIYMHGSLLGMADDSLIETGVEYEVPDKYIALHRFAIKNESFELSFWEEAIYSGRNMDLAYLNPLSFFKSVEHSLHDRDNTLMGIEFTTRFLKQFVFKGNFVLDDIIFSKIGTDYWSNKTAINLSIGASLPWSVFAGFEYARVEPYTFTHFNYQNSLTNDKYNLGSSIQPNSQSFTTKFSWFWGGRYPLTIAISYIEHGRNEYDAEGNLVRNVGGNIIEGFRYGDSETVTFLDGDFEQVYSVNMNFGYELVRNFNIFFRYWFDSVDEYNQHTVKLSFRFEDF